MQDSRRDGRRPRDPGAWMMAHLTGYGQVVRAGRRGLWALAAGGVLTLVLLVAVALGAPWPS